MPFCSKQIQFLFSKGLFKLDLDLGSRICSHIHLADFRELRARWCRVSLPVPVVRECLIYFLYVKSLCLGQEKGDECDGNQTPASKEQEDTILHVAQHAQEACKTNNKSGSIEHRPLCSFEAMWKFTGHIILKDQWPRLVRKGIVNFEHTSLSVLSAVGSMHKTSPRIGLTNYFKASNDIMHWEVRFSFLALSTDWGMLYCKALDAVPKHALVQCKQSWGLTLSNDKSEEHVCRGCHGHSCGSDLGRLNLSRDQPSKWACTSILSLGNAFKSRFNVQRVWYVKLVC